MNKPENIPGGIVLVCGWLKRGVRQFVFEDAEGYPLDAEMGGLDIVMPSHPPLLFRADNIRAEDGWGPFLTDVAMEWVTVNGGWLYPYPTCVSSDAKKMWQVYFDPAERSDVERRAMTEQEVIELGVGHPEDEQYLRCCYRKSPAKYISEMKEQGKWVERG